MTEIIFPQFLDAIRAAQCSYHKLVIIAGASGSGKTRLLHQTASALNIPAINLSLQMSQRLLSMTRRQRTLKAEEVARDAIDEQSQGSGCLDNTELLFDSALKVNPLLFLQAFSRNRLIVASWTGSVQDGDLTFGYIGHPDFFKQTARGFPVVSVLEDKLQLHFAS